MRAPGVQFSEEASAPQGVGLAVEPTAQAGRQAGGRGGRWGRALTLQLLIHDHQALLKGRPRLQQGVLGLAVVVDVQVGAAYGGPGPLQLDVVGQGTGQLQVAVLVLGCSGVATVSQPPLRANPTRHSF